MIYKTYAELNSEIEKELDLAGESFIDPEEMMGYVNDAIQEAAAHIHRLNAEDEYFLKSEDADLIQGQSEYDMPEDIYANKIKRVILTDGSDVSEVLRLKNNQRFIDIAIDSLETGKPSHYRYLLINNSADDGIKLRLTPKAQSSSGTLTVWYIRNPNLVLDDDSKIDIPQFYIFIKQFVKWKVCSKETHPNTPMEYGELERLRKLMIETLENMVMDENNLIEADMSHYEESI